MAIMIYDILRTTSEGPSGEVLAQQFTGCERKRCLVSEKVNDKLYVIFYSERLNNIGVFRSVYFAAGNVATTTGIHAIDRG